MKFKLISMGIAFFATLSVQTDAAPHYSMEEVVLTDILDSNTVASVLNKMAV